MSGGRGVSFVAADDGAEGAHQRMPRRPLLLSSREEPAQQQERFRSIEDRSLQSFLSLSRDEKLKLTGTPGRSLSGGRRRSIKYSLDGDDGGGGGGGGDDEMMSPASLHELLNLTQGTAGGDSGDFGDSLGNDDQNHFESSGGDSSGGDSHNSSSDSHDSRFGAEMRELDLLGTKAEMIAVKSLLKAKERVVEEQAAEIVELGQTIETLQARLGNIILSRLSRRIGRRGLLRAWRRWAQCSLMMRELELQRIEFESSAAKHRNLGKQEALQKSFQLRQRRRILRAWRSLVTIRDDRHVEFVRLLIVFNERMLRCALRQWKQKTVAAQADAYRVAASLHAFSCATAMLRCNKQSIGRAWATWNKLVAWKRHKERVLGVAAAVLGRRCSHVSAAFAHWRTTTTALPLFRLHAAALLEKHHHALQAQATLSQVRILFLRWRGVLERARGLVVGHCRGAQTVTLLLQLRSRQQLIRAFLRWSTRVALLAQAAVRLRAVVEFLIKQADRERLHRALRRWRRVCKETWDATQLYGRLETVRTMLQERGSKAAEVLKGLRARGEWRKLALHVLRAFSANARASFASKRGALTRNIVTVLDRIITLHGSKYRLRYALHRWHAGAVRTGAAEAGSRWLFEAVGRKALGCAWAQWSLVLHNWRTAQGLRALFRHLDLKRALGCWRRGLHKFVSRQQACLRLGRRRNVYLLRWWMRRWAHKLAVERRSERRHDVLSFMFPRWRWYCQLSRNRRVRLGHSLYLANTAGQRRCFRIWAQVARNELALFRACSIISKFFMRVPRTMLRLAVTRWRSQAALQQFHTAERVGLGLSLALKRIVAAEQGREEEVVRGSLISSECDQLRGYVRALIYSTQQSLGRRRETRLALQTLGAWRRHLHRQQLQRRTLRRVVARSIRRAQLWCLAHRLGCWRRTVVRLSRFQSGEALLRRKLQIANRRHRQAVLMRVLRCWRSRLGSRLKLLRALRVVKLSSLRRHIALFFYRWRAALLKDLTAYRTLQRTWFQRLVSWAAASRIRRMLGWKRARSMIGARRRRTLLRLLYQWRHEAERLARARQVFLRLETLSRRVACTQTFRHWSRLRDLRKAGRSFFGRLARMLWRRARGRLQSAWRLWVDETLRATWHQACTNAHRREQGWALYAVLYKRRCVPLLVQALVSWRELMLDGRRRARRDAFQLSIAVPTIRQRLAKKALRSALARWLGSPQLRAALPLRVQGYPLLAHSMPVSCYWVSALHAEAAGHRRWRTTLELVCDGLAESLSAYRPAVFVLREPRLLVGLERLGPTDATGYAAGDETAGFVEKRVLLGEGAVGRCAALGAPFAIRRAVRRGAPGSRHLVALVLPVLWHGECLGVVQLTSREALELAATDLAPTPAPAPAANESSPVPKTTTPVTPGLSPGEKRVRFESLESSPADAAGVAPRQSQTQPLRLEQGTPLLYGAEALQPPDTARLHDSAMLEAPHEEGSAGLAAALFTAALQAEPPLPLKSCLMAAPVIFTAAEVFHLHYAHKHKQPKSESLVNARSDDLHTDPSLASTLAQLHAAQRTAQQLRENLRVTEDRAALMAHELEATNARTVALCEQRVAAAVASRDKYRARALALSMSQGGLLGGNLPDKENVTKTNQSAAKRRW